MAEARITRKAGVKKIKTACRSCGKARRWENLTMTLCCKNWICDDYVDFDNRVCHRNHTKHSCCYFHFTQEHEGKWQECEECAEKGRSEYDFDDVTCVSCGFKSQTMNDFAFQLNANFYCNKDDCQRKVKPPPSKRAKRKVGAKKVNRVVVKEVKKACRDCGKISKLTKTACCNNWICDDSHKYVMFSYALNSCYRNHDRYSSCSHHLRERHEGKWQDCEICKNIICGVQSDFDDVTCISCGFKSERIERFAFQINEDFYCKKDECLKKCQQILDGIGWTPKRKDEDNEAKKAKTVCGICEKSSKLTKTKCCDNWICDNITSSGFHIYRCLRKHEEYSCCAFHHSQGHEGRAQDCERCKKRGCFKFDFEDFEQENVNIKNIPEITFTCVSCGFKSESMGAFAFELEGDFYCTKDECQKKSRPPASENSIPESKFSTVSG